MLRLKLVREAARFVDGVGLRQPLSCDIGWQDSNLRQRCNPDRQSIRIDIAKQNGTPVSLDIQASLEESVGHFWLGKVAKVVIQCDFVGFLRLKAVGFSDNQFHFVVETLDNTR